VVGIGSDGKVICQTNAGGPPGVTSPCSKSLVGNNKRIFVTSATYNGDAVRDGKADTICQTHANAGKMSGVFKALVSYSGRNPYDVLKLANSFWNCGKVGANYDWKPIANSPSAFFTQDGAGNYLENPIQYNEVGNYQSVDVWTNFKPTGSGNFTTGGGATSDRWRCGAPACYSGASWGKPTTIYGKSTSKNVGWAGNSDSWGSNYCSNCMGLYKALYCVEQ